jgi:apolipoprotein N-acyltransferase
VARWLMLAVAWVVGEWLRGWVLTGFPWNLLGYAWSERLVPLQLVSLTGIFGLTLISLLVASAPALLLDSTLPTRLRRRVAAAVALLLLILVVALGWRIYRHNLAAPTGGCAQASVGDHCRRGACRCAADG